MTRGALLAISLFSATPAFADTAACFDAHEAAQIARKRGALLKARAELATCGRTECPATVQRDCVGWAVELAAQQPSYLVAVVDEDGKDLVGARITVDGAAIAKSSIPIEVDPGVHKIHVEVKGRAAVDQAFEMREGERSKRVAIVVKSPPKPVRLVNEPRTLTWVLGGVAAAGLVSFTTFAIAGKLHEHTLADSCDGQCSDARVDGVRRLYLAADVSLGFAIVAAGAAVASWLFFPAHKPTTTASLSF